MSRFVMGTRLCSEEKRRNGLPSRLLIALYLPVYRIAVGVLNLVIVSLETVVPWHGSLALRAEPAASG
jgi:hypothetical protein